MLKFQFTVSQIRAHLQESDSRIVVRKAESGYATIAAGLCPAAGREKRRHRYHEGLGNLTPADLYCGRDRAIIERRRKIKKQTVEKRRLAHQRQAA